MLNQTGWICIAVSVSAVIMLMIATLRRGLRGQVLETPLVQLRQRRLAQWHAIRALAYVLVVLLLLGAMSIFLEGAEWGTKTLAEIGLAAGFSALVGFGELVSRYKDDPLRLVGSPATIVYLSVNGAAGIAALALVQEFDVFGHNQTPMAHKAVYEVLLASFGAIAFFRTSLFTARVGDMDVGIGPSTLLQSLLGASDLILDRDQAGNRASDVARIMKDVVFEKACVSLPTLCLALVQGLTQEQQKLIGEQVSKMIDDKSPLPNESKSVILGVYLLRQVGASVLESAVLTLGAQIQRTPADGPAPVSPQVAVDKDG